MVPGREGRSDIVDVVPETLYRPVELWHQKCSPTPGRAPFHGLTISHLNRTKNTPIAFIRIRPKINQVKADTFVPPQAPCVISLEHLSVSKCHQGTLATSPTNLINRLVATSEERLQLIASERSNTRPRFKLGKMFSRVPFMADLLGIFTK